MPTKLEGHFYECPDCNGDIAGAGHKEDCISAKGYHRLMTAEEYLAANIKGWHEVYWNVDGFGHVGVRYLGDAR